MTAGIIIGSIVLFLVLAYFLFGIIFFERFFKRSNKPIHFKNDLSKKYDFTPDMDWVNAQPYWESEVPGTDGAMRLRVKTMGDSHRYLICLHGFKGYFCSHSRINRRLGEGLRANVVMCTLRGDHDSGKAYTSVGIKESDDLLLAINFLLKRDPEAKFYILGVSMGAATAIFAADRYPSQVVGVVADSGFSSLKDEMLYEFHPHLGIFSRFFLLSVSLCYRLHFKVAMTRYSDAALKTTMTPFFFIHGSKDTFVPVENMAHHLQELNPRVKKSSWLIEDCPHAIGDFVNPDAYAKTVLAFYDSLEK